MALATTLLLTTTSASPMNNHEDEVPPSRIIRNEDLYDVMLTQSTHLHDPSHRHLHSLTTDQKSTVIRDNWLPISSDTQFLPNLLLSDTARRRLGGYDVSNPYSAEPFVDGLEYYDEDAQSWRKLGFIIDCQANDEEMYSEHSQHSGDENQNMITETGCARYLIWAAYVNENYQGNGAAEYSYYDPYYKKWDETTCTYANGSPCTPMDCHLSSTSFSLLGFFKHRVIDDWMEQLFKHQGICTWSNEDYAFMKNARKAWPQGCTMTNTKTRGGNPLYYDLKPSYSGTITIGMYLDEECVNEYYMSTSDIEKIIGNIFANAGSQHSQDNNNDDATTYDFSSESLSKSLDRWNKAFDIWSICHSCVSHDLSNTDGSTYFGECYDDQYYAYKNYYSNDDKDSYYNAYNQYYNNNNNNNGNGNYCISNSYGSNNGDDGNNDGYNYGNNDDGNNDDADHRYYAYGDDANAYNDDGGGGRKLFGGQQQRQLGGEYCPKGCPFECYDDAGYTSVNQCMKFSAKTVMRTASFRDLSMANLQGTLTAASLSGYVDQTFEFHSKTKTNALTYTFLVSMSLLCLGSLYYLVQIIGEASRSRAAPALTQTLV
eukprot:CAMPEP_0201719796 /NCGR_PEP_ID=MMETSP0593-20130828/4918_1 /ASSEMBLY_ACC=CAM_ASM_000672 /TAXON_ID=267983 /ORGANISM="Skeletonema japonicum, Strain CCMP2506" /LENGTH=598 /DNA_ID=CAMNT_0048210315 /DNA_START=217 /DNA_END=2013 /DNA_ORIENTATION=-